jgi:hypothetical protein
MMAFKLITLRYHQIKRELLHTGFFYSLILLAFLAAVLVGLNWFILTHEHAYYASAIGALLLWGIHVNRHDLDFVHHHITLPQWNMFLEYGATATPLVLILSLKGFFLQALVLMVSCMVMVFFKPIRSVSTFWPSLSQFIPQKNFEWVGGIRASKGWSVVALAALWATCWLKFVPLFIFWINTLIIAGFYQYGEPLILLFQYKNSNMLIYEKIKNALLLTYLFTLIPLIINTLIFPSFWWVNVLYFIIGSCIITCSILIKYAVYHPNRKLTEGSLLLSITGLSGIIPFMLPIPVFVAIRQYFKAKQNLQFYFNDQH